MLVLVVIYSLEVLRDSLVHLVSVADHLVLHEDQSHYWVAALHPHDFFHRGLEGFHVASPVVLEIGRAHV